MRLRAPATLAIGILVGWLLCWLTASRQADYSWPAVTRCADSSADGGGAQVGFAARYEWLRARQNRSLYYFDRQGRLIPMLRLAGQETQRAYRQAEAREWLLTQSLVIAATVRNAMPGLVTSLKNLARLRRLFARSWMLFVENDSQDRTREVLLELARSDPSVAVLGCGTINSPMPCSVDMRYSSGRRHMPGQILKRSMSEEVDRGLIMSALRNEYLDVAYNFSSDMHVDLLLVIDSDVEWSDWDLGNILQGLYYFKTRPRLQQLCANTIDLPSAKLFDPCTLTFFNNKHFGEDTLYPSVDYYKSIYRGGSDLPPVKVESCFQAFAFYRLSELRASRLHYERSHGEWMCEHNTLSRQLLEVYIDPQMRLDVKAANVG